ncbi:hypothetical protein EDB82DRAFT_539824 [Fusarium venenatum]|uniref:uncharacterized protein n=1 Tax=Fusarium venenatum TaxID=56646 RepID=UPI001D534BD2|nr:hypothetical protein EDB82DRAFT_539824 [Fusarium venenatum]
MPVWPLSRPLPVHGRSPPVQYPSAPDWEIGNSLHTGSREPSEVGESYKELSGQDLPTSGSITKTFEDSGRLVFRNSGLPNGQAGFCQTPDGIVYVTFTNGPVGCIPVELVVYDVTRCQDGQLVGEDDVTATASETISQDTTTPGQPDSEVTSGIEDATTVEITSSNSKDSTSQPGSIGSSSQTSDIDASDIVLSETTGPSGSSISATMSISQSEISATDTVDPSSELGPTSSSSTTDWPDDTTSVALDTTDFDTMTAGTATTDTTTMSSGAPNPGCANTNNPYTASNGVTFTLACNTIVSSILLEQLESTNFISCVQACSENEACVAAELFRPTSTCLLFSYVYEGSAEDNDTRDVAFKNPVIADTTTATTDASATNSNAPKPECTSTDNPYTVSNGVTFTLYCDTTTNGFAPVRFFTAENFILCMQACSEIETCVGVEFNRLNSACVTVSQIIGGTSQAVGSSDVALKDPIVGDTTTTTASTMTADATTADATTADVPILETTTTDALVADTTTSAAPTETSSASTCKDLDNPLTDGGDIFQIFCGAYVSSASIEQFEIASFLGCIQACGQDGTCSGVVYGKESRICILWEFTTSDFAYDTPYDIAVRQDI